MFVLYNIIIIIIRNADIATLLLSIKNHSITYEVGCWESGIIPINLLLNETSMFHRSTVYLEICKKQEKSVSIKNRKKVIKPRVTAWAETCSKLNKRLNSILTDKSTTKDSRCLHWPLNGIMFLNISQTISWDWECCILLVGNLKRGSLF